MIDWKDSEVLVIGGTGSLGTEIIRQLILMYQPKGVRIFSRDEFKQYQMRQQIKAQRVAWLIGDVRDYERLYLAMHNVDIVINCAAMKQVPACEDNPLEAVKTNVHGAENIVMAALENKVRLVMHISTDKAVYPVNLYGATKAVAEKIFLHGNVYSGRLPTKFSICRYGNVIGSRGSVIPFFKELAGKNLPLPITDTRATRFWIHLSDVAKFIINCAAITKGKQIFIPHMPSMNILDLALAIAPESIIQETGLRFGEKLHECLITQEEMNSVDVDYDGKVFTIDPEHYYPKLIGHEEPYTSETNSWKLSVDDLRELI